MEQAALNSQLSTSPVLVEIEVHLRRAHAAGAVAVAELAAVEPGEKGDDEGELDGEAEHGNGGGGGQLRNLRMRATRTPWMTSSRTGRRSGKRGFSAFK